MELLHEMDDSGLLQRIAQGNASAFAHLVRRHSQRFYRIAYRFTLNRQEAEDIVQDAFLKLWERPDQWNPKANTKFTTWFYRIIVNRALDTKRRKKPLPILEDMEFEDSTPKQDDMLINRQRQQQLEYEMAQLPQRQQVALNLCFYEGLSNQEAADIMKLNLKALQSLIMRAKTTLKEKVDRESEKRHDQ